MAYVTIKVSFLGNIILHDSSMPGEPGNHWGRGDLETSGNILGKLWALDHFSPNVLTNRILGTFRL